MADILTDLQSKIAARRAEKEEGSYTAYLFEKGLDKILKKVGEESAETIIAAKNLKAADAADAGERRAELVGEIGDLLYHLEVMMAELGVGADEVEGVLRARMEKQGNLKQAHAQSQQS